MVQGDEVGPLGAGLCIHMALGQTDRIIIIKVIWHGADRDRAVSAPEHLGIRVGHTRLVESIHCSDMIFETPYS